MEDYENIEMENWDVPKTVIDISMSENPTLYEYCRKLTALYETKAHIFEMGFKMDEEFEDLVCEEILKTETEMKEKIRNFEL